MGDNLETLKSELRKMAWDGSHDGLGNAIVTIRLFASVAQESLRELEALDCDDCIKAAEGNGKIESLEKAVCSNGHDITTLDNSLGRAISRAGIVDASVAQLAAQVAKLVEAVAATEDRLAELDSPLFGVVPEKT